MRMMILMMMMIIMKITGNPPALTFKAYWSRNAPPV
jgi:hypothetical protein